LQTPEQVVKKNNSSNIIPEEEDVLKSTPFIPQSVYDNLPPILLESCKAFNDGKRRILTGALAILSGCLPNVSGVYHGSNGLSLLIFVYFSSCSFWQRSIKILQKH
jgi:hypothetical protein